MRYLAATFVTGSAALAWCVPAVAQTGPDDGTTPINEIIVTAQFRKQDPIDVPIALTAVDGKTLERIGVEDLEELARFVPGFEVQNQSPNNAGFVMRGITSDSGTAFNEPRVSVFQDGVSISKSRGAFVELFDLERVEVAKGPQTTLYGRSALIGAVNLIQNKADPSGFSASAKGEYGNLDYVLGEGMVNVPLGKNAAIRVSGRYRKRDGTVKNLLGGRDFGSLDTAAVRAGLRLEPGDRLTFDVIGNYQHDTPTGTAFIALTQSQTDPATGEVLAPLSPFSGAALSNQPGVEGGRALGFDREVYGVTGLVDYELDDTLHLASVSAWRRFNALEVFDADGTSLPILAAAEDARGQQFSQDLRLRWDDGGALSGFIGGSFFWERGSQRIPTSFDERVLLAQITGALNGFIPDRPIDQPAPLSVLTNSAFDALLLRGLAGASGVLVSNSLASAIAANLKPAHQETSTNFGRTEAWDAFADVTWRPVEWLEINGGIRYSNSDKLSAISSEVLNGRSILGGFIGALSQPSAVRTALLNALAVPGAATIPESAIYPVPLFGLAGQPTANNGDKVESYLTDDGWSYRATARYAPNDDSSIYLGYGRGRRPQELSARTPSTPGGAARFETLLAETVDSFEMGAKTALLDRRLFLDGALFHYRYRNFQTTEQDGVLFVTTNAGKARSTGFEGQVRFQATDNIQFFANYAYNHSRFRSGVRRGNHFRLSPDHSFAAGMIGEVPLGERSGSVSFASTVTYQSKTFFDSDNDRPELQQPPNALVADNLQDEFQDGFALVNARLGYVAPGRRWKIEGFVENLFDHRFLKDAGNTGDAIGLATAVPGTPRTYGVSISVAFGQ